MVVARLLRLTSAVSLSAFLTALIGSVCFSLWLPGADALVTLQKAFVATLFMSSLAALPFAFGWARTRRERVLTSAVGWIAILAALSGLAWMFFSAPLGAFLVALFLVPLGLIFFVVGLPVFVLIIRRFDNGAPAVSDWRTRSLAVVAFVPFAIYALPTPDHCTQLLRPGHIDAGTISVEVDRPDWPRLESVMQRYATAHGMYFQGTSPWKLRETQLDIALCAGDSVIFRGLSQTRFDDQGRSTDRKQVIFDVNFWKPGKDWRSTVDEFVSALDAEWHGGAKFELTPAFKPRLESLEAPSSPGTK